MKSRTGNIVLIGIGILLLILMLYLFFLRNLVASAYLGQAPEWVQNSINLLYPRFQVEKHRFPLEFFLSKTDQIIFRLFFIGSILFGGVYVLQTQQKTYKKFHNFWNQQTSTQNTQIIRILYFSFLIIIFHDIYQDLMRLEHASIFYKPITLYRILNIPYPSPEAILAICILLFLSCALSILNIYSVVSSIIAVLIFSIIQGFIFSFEKYDHGFATFTYAGMIMPFLLYERKVAIQKKLPMQQAWPLILIITCICLSYFYTGLEKLFISGPDWLSGKSLRSHLLTHDIPAGKLIVEHSSLIILLANLTLITQIGFISILFKEKLKYIFIPAGFLFHMGVAVLMGIGGLLNPWILSYIFFFDWSKLRLKRVTN